MAETSADTHHAHSQSEARTTDAFQTFSMWIVNYEFDINFFLEFIDWALLLNLSNDVQKTMGWETLVISYQWCCKNFFFFVSRSHRSVSRVGVKSFKGDLWTERSDEIEQLDAYFLLVISNTCWTARFRRINIPNPISYSFWHDLYSSESHFKEFLTKLQLQFVYISWWFFKFISSSIIEDNYPS